MTAFTGVDSQNLPDVMVSVQFIIAIGEEKKSDKSYKAIEIIALPKRSYILREYLFL
ncbi:hypothetical protein [Lactobacillus delbrueckii]|uniref:hypothetical protein n=1 Tax=Lactobacillus delbrueckii TaxID=1584 RepID=UPI0013E9617B|nr:hypothetical protein [Lactobacillus delbrueckii]